MVQVWLLKGTAAACGSGGATSLPLRRTPVAPTFVKDRVESSQRRKARCPLGHRVESQTTVSSQVARILMWRALGGLSQAHSVASQPRTAGMAGRSSLTGAKPFQLHAEQRRTHPCCSLKSRRHSTPAGTAHPCPGVLARTLAWLFAQPRPELAQTGPLRSFCLAAAFGLSLPPRHSFRWVASGPEPQTTQACMHCQRGSRRPGRIALRIAGDAPPIRPPAPVPNAQPPHVVLARAAPPNALLAAAPRACVSPKRRHLPPPRCG